MHEIDRLLRLNGKSLHDFTTLPLPDDVPVIDSVNHLILQELAYDKEALKCQAIALLSKLNAEQMSTYKEIMGAVNKKLGGFFFVYGYGGTGKTFLWNTLLSSIRRRGKIALAVPSSGIAALLLPGG